MLQTKKVGIVGIGHVGSHCALAMLLQGVCDEMVLMDILPEKAKGYAIDCMDTVSFQFSCETYMMYYREKYGQDIFFYTRKNGKYVKVEDLEELRHLKSRVMVSVDLGSEVDFIAHDLDARVKPLTEELEDDELLINIVERLGDKASWKNSKMRVVELQEC